MSLYGTPQFNKVTTIATGSTLNPPATSTIITTAVFGSPSGTQLLVIDYGNSNAVVIACTISGTTISGITYLDGNVGANHSAGASVTMAFTPTQYTSLIDGSGLQFPAWTSWTPTYNGSGAMTFTGVSTAYAKYQQIGKRIDFMLEATGTTGGTASNILTFTLPIAKASVTGMFAAQVGDTGNLGGFAVLISSTVVAIEKYDLSNFGIGAGRTIRCAGTYESV